MMRLFETSQLISPHDIKPIQGLQPGLRYRELRIECFPVVDHFDVVVGRDSNAGCILKFSCQRQDHVRLLAQHEKPKSVTF